jgi:hypothetical protein
VRDLDKSQDIGFSRPGQEEAERARVLIAHKDVVIETG